MECGQRGRCGCESEKDGYKLGSASTTQMRADKVQVQVGNGRQSRVAHLKSVNLQSKTRDQNLTARETRGDERKEYLYPCNYKPKRKRGVSGRRKREEKKGMRNQRNKGRSIGKKGGRE